MGEASNQYGGLGAMDIYTESETNFFLGIGVNLIFNKDERQKGTSVIRPVPGWPDREGKRRADKATTDGGRVDTDGDCRLLIASCQLRDSDGGSNSEVATARRAACPRMTRSIDGHGWPWR